MSVFAGVCESIGLPRPIPEYSWHSTRKFLADFAFLRDRILLEVDGGVFGKGKKCPVCGRRPGGAHSSIKDILRDMERSNEAQLEGWWMLRVLPQDLDNGKALDLLEKAVKIKRQNPSPR